MNSKNLTQYIVLFLKFFLFFSFFFGLAVTFLFYFLRPGTITFVQAINLGLFCGSSFGLVMAIVVVIMQINSKGVFEVRPTREVELGLDFNISFDKAINALSQLGFQTKTKDKEKGVIESSTKASMRSYFGENIKISLSNLNGKVLVKVSSKPKNPIQFYDPSGKNLQNVESIIAALQGNAVPPISQDGISTLTNTRTPMGAGVKILITYFIVLFVPGLLLGIWFGVKGSDQTLGERSLELSGKQLSILIPKNHLTGQESKSGNIVSKGFGKYDESISNILIFYGPSKSSYQTSCTALNRALAFNISLINFGKKVEVCKIPSKDNSANINLTLDNIKNNDYYSVIVEVNVDYLNTKEGRSKVEQIFQSFKVLN